MTHPSTPDTDRQATYDAEHHAFDGTLLDVVCGPEIAIAATNVLVSFGDWWGDRCPRTVECRRTRSDATRSHAEVRTAPTPSTIAYSPTCTWGAVLHELAHVYAGPGHGHDGVFRACHIELVAVLYDPVLATELLNAYIAADLTPCPPMNTPAEAMHPAGPALKLFQAQVFGEELRDDHRDPPPPPRTFAL